MDLTNRSRRWAVAVAVMVCMVAPLLVACSHAPEPPKEAPQMQQQRKEKRDG